MPKVMSHKNVTIVVMIMVSVFRCQDDTEDRAQKTDDRRKRADCFCFLTPETFIFEKEDS